MTGSDAFDAARRRYNAAHGIPETGQRCGAVLSIAETWECADIAGHPGKHHAFIGAMVVYWDGSQFGSV